MCHGGGAYLIAISRKVSDSVFVLVCRDLKFFELVIGTLNFVYNVICHVIFLW